MDEIVGATEIPHEGTGVGKPLELVFPPLPVNLWRPLPEVPAEKIGSGLNKKVRAFIELSKECVPIIIRN